MNKGGSNGAREVGFWNRQIDKLGVGGSIFSSFIAGLCCLGPPAIMSILSAFGLTFLINNAILQPIMIVFLLLSVFGLVLGWRHHGSPWAFIIGVLGALTAYVFRFVLSNSLLAWLGIACLLLASLMNVFLRRHSPYAGHSGRAHGHISREEASNLFVEAT
jgi:mercuric ion transport protein